MAQPNSKDYQLVNAQAAEAAKWMHEEMKRNKGTLTLDAAWAGVREKFGESFARSDDTGTWLSKPILVAFRKVTPTAMWDPTGKCWLDKQDASSSGLRMM